MIKNILVAVDGSEYSNRALDFALDLAEKYRAPVTLLNVSESPAMGTVPLEPTTISGDNIVLFSKDLRRLHENILSKAVAHAKEENPKVTVLSKLREGDPASEIAAETKESAFDVVVVGHRGQSRIREVFLGSVSEKVSHSAPCSVIIVR